MKRFLLLSLILFFCNLSAAFADILTCTHSPQNIVLAPGGSEVVAYNCTTPIVGQDFVVGFQSSSPSITTTAGAPAAANYQSTVTASPAAASGTYIVATSKISVAGGSYVEALDANGPLQVTVQSGPDVTITPSVTGGNGAISPNTVVQLPYGGSQLFSANPVSTSYEVSAWTVDGSTYLACGTALTCTLSDVTANHTISVSFAEISPSVSGELTCDTPYTIGGTDSICSLTLRNASTVAATSVVITPSATNSASISGIVSNGCNGAVAANSHCTNTYHFSSSTAGSSTVSMGYSDHESDAVTITPAVVTVNPADVEPSVTGTLSCSPSTITISGVNATCTLTLTNASPVAATGVVITPAATNSGYLAFGTDGCSGTVAGNRFCVMTYTFLSSTPGSSTVSMGYADAQSDVVTIPTAAMTVNVAPSHVTGVANCGTPNTLYPGTSPIICQVTYTNSSGSTISNPMYSTLLAQGAGNIGSPSPSGSCTSFQTGSGSTCLVTYSYAPSASIHNPILRLNMLTSGAASLAEAVTSVQWRQPVTVFEPGGALTCDPATVPLGNTSVCTLKLDNAGPISYSATLTPRSALGGTFSPSTISQAIAIGKNTITFNYTAPSSISGNQEDTLNVDYSDDWGDSVTIPSATVSLLSMFTTSGIRCYPEVATPGALLTCNMYMTNVTGSAVAAPAMTALIGETKVSTIITCSGSVTSTLPSNTPCVVSFLRTLPNRNMTSIPVEVSPSPANAGTFTESIATIPVYPSAMPNIQSNPLVCNDTELAIGGAGTTCSVTFRNLGTTTATGVTLTPAVNVGSTSGASTSCSNATLGTMATNDTCSLTFTYTPPASTVSDNFANISVTYHDTQLSYAAFPSAFAILLSVPNTGVTASVIPNASNDMPLNNVKYENATDGSGTLQVIFHFINNTGGDITFTSPVVNTVVNGVARDVTYAIDTNIVDSSCLASTSLPDQSGCNLQVNFTPYQFDGFAVGNQVTLAAWLPLSSPAGLSSIGTWNFSIGQGPIFTNVNTNELFVNGGSNLVGAFLFGNGSAHILTNLRSPRIFLPQGFSSVADNVCVNAGLLSSYMGAVPCSSLDNASLAIGSYCYACFQVAGTAMGQNQMFEAQLSSDQSVVTAERIVPVTPSYRTLTLVNACPGGSVNPVTGEPAGTVWPAFVSGAAYFFCNQDSDCPINSTCYKSGHQCRATVSTGCVAVPAVCPNGSVCNSDNGLCYWSSPTATTSFGSAVLTPGSSVDMQIPNVPLTKAGDWSTVWSGGLVPRTGCHYDAAQDKFECDAGTCTVVSPNSDNSCKPGSGGLTPVTQAEFTYLYNNIDYYDVEIINGFSIPMSMKPNPIQTLDPTSPYTCNVTGEQVSTPDPAPYDQCTWDFTMNTYNLTLNDHPTLYSPNVQALHALVAGGSQTSCTPSIATPNPCTSGEVCGLSQLNSTGITTTPRFTCGLMVGVWSSSQLCGSNTSMDYADPDGSGYTLKCNTAYADTNGSHQSNTLSAWFGCNSGSAQNSCYSANAVEGCCGGPYWEAGAKPDQAFPVINGTNIGPQLISLFPSGYTLYPNANNDYGQAYSSAWVQQVYEPSLIWMKQGCASLYTFPYDDATSTFTCSSNSLSGGHTQNPAGKVNTQNYTITFCPGHNTGEVNQPGSSTAFNSIVVP